MTKSNPFADPSERSLRSSKSSLSATSDKSSVHKSTQKHKSKSHKSKRSKPASAPLDTIDKLDVSSIGFHHDGPFDACNPHRNKDTNKKAPMKAFPAQSVNMTGSSAHARKRSTSDAATVIVPPGRNRAGSHNKIDPESSALVHKMTKNGSVVSLQPEFDASTSAKPVHGETTDGLGSSTFLEGAPAPRVPLTKSRSRSIGTS